MYILYVLFLTAFIYVMYMATRRQNILGFVEEYAERWFYGTKFSILEKIFGGCLMCTLNFWSIVGVIAWWCAFGRPFESVNLLLNIWFSLMSSSVVVILGLVTHNFLTRK